MSKSVIVKYLIWWRMGNILWEISWIYVDVFCYALVVLCDEQCPVVWVLIYFLESPCSNNFNHNTEPKPDNQHRNPNNNPNNNPTKPAPIITPTPIIILLLPNPPHKQQRIPPNIDIPKISHIQLTRLMPNNPNTKIPHNIHIQISNIYHTIQYIHNISSIIGE